MPVDPIANAVETFSAPIEGLIIALGKGISEAQAELDRNSIKSQEAIDTDPVLSQLGLQATWYQFPSVQLELKLALTMVEERTTPRVNPSSLVGDVSASARGVAALAANTSFLVDTSIGRRLVAQPVSAAYQNHFNYNAQASSTITLSIVPVPAPRPVDQASSPPLLTDAQVQEKALGSPAPFVSVIVDGKKAPSPGLRFDINFNASARLWYVLQYSATAPESKAVVVVVDDVTGLVRVIS